MGREQKKLSVANQMLIAMAAGIIVGIIMMLLKSFLINGGNEKIWSMIDWEGVNFFVSLKLEVPFSWN